MTGIAKVSVAESKNCMDCPKHLVINDRDPDDWFCDDDVAIVCSDTANPKRDMQSRHLSNHSKFRAITVACRPYRMRQESDQPEWCPILCGGAAKANPSPAA